MKTLCQIFLLVILFLSQACGLVQNRNSYGSKHRKSLSPKFNKHTFVAARQEVSNVGADTIDLTVEIISKSAVISTIDTVVLMNRSNDLNNNLITAEDAVVPNATENSPETKNNPIHSMEMNDEEHRLDWAACISFFSFVLGALAVLAFVFFNVSLAMSDVLIATASISFLVGIVFLLVSKILIRYFGMPETNYHTAAHIGFLVTGMAAVVAYIVFIYELLYGF